MVLNRVFGSAIQAHRFAAEHAARSQQLHKFVPLGDLLQGLQRPAAVTPLAEAFSVQKLCCVQVATRPAEMLYLHFFLWIRPFPTMIAAIVVSIAVSIRVLDGAVRGEDSCCRQTSVEKATFIDWSPNWQDPSSTLKKCRRPAEARWQRHTED